MPASSFSSNGVLDCYSLVDPMTCSAEWIPWSHLRIMKHMNRLEVFEFSAVIPWFSLNSRSPVANEKMYTCYLQQAIPWSIDLTWSWKFSALAALWVETTSWARSLIWGCIRWTIWEGSCIVGLLPVHHTAVPAASSCPWVGPLAATRRSWVQLLCAVWLSLHAILHKPNW
jgi:hypothetical protein